MADEPKTAEWWEKQARRYKEETAEIQHKCDALVAADKAEQKALQEQVDELHAAHRETSDRLRAALDLATARKTALAEVLRAMAVALEKCTPLLDS